MVATRSTAAWGGAGPRMVARLRRAALGLCRPRTVRGHRSTEVLVMDTASTVLVADVDGPMRMFLSDQLTADGYHVLTASRAAEVKARAARGTVRLLVLGDFEHVGESVALLREIRAGDGRHGQLDPALPIILVSRDGGELAALRGLEAGADDHVAKPFSYPELRARLAAVLRRVDGRPVAVVRRVGELELDRSSREVRLRGQRIELSQKEFALLDALCEDPSRVYTKEELLRGVWGFRSMGQTRTLDSHACRLRRKLAAVAGDRFMVNVWGVGYRLVDPIGADYEQAA
jgi:DNA-binding response OmpR family regulator